MKRDLFVVEKPENHKSHGRSNSMTRPLLAAVTAASLLSMELRADLPVRNVILYKHGVGYFERSGTLAAGEAVQFDFKAEEMNDVLKSLTVDVKGGAIAGVRYDSAEPLEKKLGEIPIRLGEQQPLSTLLDQLKGARIELRYGNDVVTGTIVSARLIGAGDNRPEREQVTVLTDAGELRNLDLSAASSIKFTDPKLQAQLRDYLTTVTQARSQERRSVYIDANGGNGQRQVDATYMLPMPVWKSSYRLIFPEAPAAGEPTLEGWAIVDNTTADDWTNVRLSLVSGRPISFVSSLYEPRYVDRPHADVADATAARPEVYGGVVGGVITAAAPPPPPAPAMRPKAMAEAAQDRAFAGSAGGFPSVITREEVRATTSNIAATADSRELGELFEYSFSNPVTVRAGQSAMLPFLQQKIGARKLLIYSNRGLQNPYNAAELTNSTGKTLDGGPITVIDNGAYAGEALVETVKQGDKRLISYGVDLGTRVTTKLDTNSVLTREIHVRRGVLTASMARRTTTTFTIRNVDARAKTLLIEHPIVPGTNLLNMQPKETSADKYRFEVPLAANETKTFAVTEETPYSQSFSLTNFTPDQLASYVQNRDLPQAARNQLQQIADKKRDIAQADAEVTRLQRDVDNLFRDQQRIRENISNLNNVAGQQAQVQTYAAQLTRQEAELARIRDQQSAAERRKTTAQSELDALIDKMEF